MVYVDLTAWTPLRPRPATEQVNMRSLAQHIEFSISPANKLDENAHGFELVRETGRRRSAAGPLNIYDTTLK